MLSSFHVLTDHWQEIANGVALTIYTWAAGTVAGIALGLILAIAKQNLPRYLGVLVDAYVGVLRGTPFLVQLFLLYYGGPFVGVSLPPLSAGIIGLSIFASAYFAEIFRAGFLAVPPGQIEAAKMSNLSPTQTLFHIVIPQMLIVIFPSLMNMVVILIKETAVLSVITVSELTATLSNIGSVTFAYGPTLAFLALFYWASLELMSHAGQAVEKRIGRYVAHQE